MISLYRYGSNPMKYVTRKVTFPRALISNQPHRPSGVRMGWSRNVIAELLPFSSELISVRGRPMENIAVGYCIPQPIMIVDNPPEGYLNTQRRVEDSWLEMILPFSDQLLLRESMIRNDGCTIRYGKLFEILDALAADVAYRHCGESNEAGKKHTQAVVTASVDGVKASANINVMNDLKLQSYLTYVGKSSMEVTIDIITVNPDGTETKVGDTQFIMVATDPKTGKSSKVHSLYLNDDNAKVKFDRGKNRVALRLLKNLKSLSKIAPSPEEIDIIHKLYLASKEVKMQKEAIINSYLSNPSIIKKGNGNGSDPIIDPIETLSVENLPQFQPLRTATSILPLIGKETLPDQLQHYRRNLKWMKKTRFVNTLYMHPQERNIHGKIFGGYLMKEAFELAWIGAMCFFDGGTPVFMSVDDIQFVKPVSVGSVMEFTSTVVYSQDLFIVVQVDAYKVDPSSSFRSKTNVLSYIFTAPSNVSFIRQIMPSEYDEFVLFLEGRRILEAYFLSSPKCILF